MIEEAVLEQLRTALRASETREQLNVPEADWQTFEEGHFELVRVVEPVMGGGTAPPAGREALLQAMRRTQ